MCTVPRIIKNEDLPGHGQQWDFKIRVTEDGAAPTAREGTHAESDPESFYSTQAVAEDLAFTRGRELVDGT